MMENEKLQKKFEEVLAAAEALVDDASTPDLVNGIGSFVGGEFLDRLKAAIASFKATHVAGFTIVACEGMEPNHAYVIVNGKVQGKLINLAVDAPSGQINALVQAPPKPLDHIDVTIVVGEENAHN